MLQHGPQNMREIRPDSKARLARRTPAILPTAFSDAVHEFSERVSTRLSKQKSSQGCHADDQLGNEVPDEGINLEELSIAIPTDDEALSYTRREFFQDIGKRLANTAMKVILCQGAVMALFEIESMVSSTASADSGENPSLKDGEARLGNASANELKRKLDRDPRWSSFRATILAPFIEEMTYRWCPHYTFDILTALSERRVTLPSLFFESEFGSAWRIGVPVSIMFALAHNIHVSAESTSMRKDSIPLPQFLTGMTLWSISRHEGPCYAFIGHSMLNVPWVLSSLLDIK